jgi:hypothetical protein
MNAKLELANVLCNCSKTIKDIKYGSVLYYGFSHDGTHELKIVVDENLDIGLLNFDYDNGFGGQRLYGIIVFNDGTWLERSEYDGSEWWAFKQTPNEADCYALLSESY